MKPPPFGYARPDSVAEATSLLRDLGSEAKVLAGGQSLVPLLNFRLAQPTYLVDVNGLTGLGDVDCESGLAVGALTRHRSLERNPGLRLAPWTAFAEGIRMVGHLPVRVRGTVGGSLAHADPSAELPLLATTFGGAVTAESADATREIPIEDFFQGFLTTSLEPTELLTGVRISEPPLGAVSAFEEFAERSGDFAIVAVCGAMVLGGDGSCRWVRIGVAGAEPAPRRATDAEESLIGRPPTDTAIREAASIVERTFEPVSDTRADAAFRRELMRVLTDRVLHRLSERTSASTPAQVVR
jgi:CO/xanthine dehydrogenase FAD-binding subunit